MHAPVDAGKRHRRADAARAMSRGRCCSASTRARRSVKAALFDSELRAVAEARAGRALAHPRPGWVEQDPELILEAVVDAVAEVLEHAGGREVWRAGLDHQGESVLAWDAGSGRALTPVVVWQDKRQEALLAARSTGGRLERSGLPLDPYFSAGKLAWLLANDAGVRAGARRRARCAWAPSTRSSRAPRGPLRDRPLDRLAHPAAGARRAATGTRSCWTRSVLRREWLPASVRASGRSASCATSAGRQALPLTRAARRPAGGAGRLGAVAPGRAEGDVRHRRVRARPHATAPVARERTAADGGLGRAGPRGRLGEVAYALDGGRVRGGFAARLAGARPRPGGGRRRRSPRRRPACRTAPA